jgi:hypothetical protein
MVGSWGTFNAQRRYNGPILDVLSGPCNPQQQMCIDYPDTLLLIPFAGMLLVGATMLLIAQR